jgi:hypothetical protein
VDRERTAELLRDYWSIPERRGRRSSAGSLGTTRVRVVALRHA